MDKERLLKSDAVRVGALAALGLALGIYSILATVLISKDSVFYIGQAQSFARDPLSVLQRGSPGYPFLLWLAHSATGAGDSVFSWIHVSQGVTLVCRLLTLIALYFLGKRLVGGTRAFWAVAILTVLPYPAESGHDVLRDWPYVMFLSFGLWLLYWAAQRRKWWAFALVGLDAGLGYFIQPICAQLILYGLFAATVVAMSRRRWRPLTAIALLVAGFAVPVAPYVYATGAIVPRQWTPPTFNSAPAIVSVGGKGASIDALEFEVRQGELLEIAVEASDPQGDKPALSLVSVPVGSRPVYQLRLTASDSRFATVSEDEKNTLLEIYPPGVAHYEGIVYYAYAQSDVRPGLEPVHRFWSAAQQRHFYTIDPSEKDEIVAEPSSDGWTHEGIAFYAFPPGRQPPDAVPIRRLWSDRAGYSWTVVTPGREAAPVSDVNAVDDGIAWYANIGGEPPADMSLEGTTLRWRPGQQGEYQVNIIVSDGHLETCQLVKVKVAGPTAANPQSAIHNPQSVHAGVQSLPGSVDRLFDAIAENLMVFFLLPWCLGLYHRLRHEADRLERVLTPTIIAVNIALVLARDAWIGPGATRRYCLALIALTIFYVPVGLELIAQWLSRVAAQRLRHAPAFLPSSHRTFLVLVAIGLVICLPKLLRPLYGDKRGYLTAVQWLRDNTRSQDVIAVPDSRLTFYAQRQGPIYINDIDPRRVDYIVRIVGKDAKPSEPAGWSREYSVAAGRGKTLIIYNTHRRKG